ncbi:TetR/AcrR family transcriptional regulator [Demequina flava]|uniref:TetR/AcrR family transcriptional regulator n=1 Tax=Demequina flava TaxID=1095025 RepID=UPI000782EF33|nr:TetR/AcrR family transcriptional regulator [Demequina flava]
MPIRPPEHHDQRRAQILSAALTCFSRDGFHGASMSDIIAEAGVSAGTVYRYFPSKAELTIAAAQSVFMPARNQFSHFTSAAPPARPTAAIAHVFEELVTRADAGPLRMTPLILEVWAEATRDDGLRTPLTEVYDGIRGDIRTLVARWQDAGHLAADADVDALTSALAALMPGLLVARTVEGRADAGDALIAFGEATGL